MKKKLFITLIIIVIIAIAVWLIFFRSSQHKAMPKMPPVLVKTQKIKKINYPVILQSVGNLAARRAVKVNAEVGGYVTKVLFHSGECVTKAQPLIQLDAVKAKADFLSTKAAYHAEQQKYKRFQKLFKLRYESPQALETEQATLEAKKAAMQTEEKTLKQHTIRAPFAGCLGERTVNVGDYLQTGQDMVSLVDRKQLKIDYAVPEKYLSQLKLGQEVHIKTTAYPAQVFLGKVTYIAPSADQDTHTIALQASIPNKDDKLSPGLFVNIHHIIRAKHSVIVVPEQAVLWHQKNAFVYRLVKGKAQKAIIQPGPLFKGKMVILSGLKTGDVVVIAGEYQLHPGAKVKVVSS